MKRQFKFFVMALAFAFTSEANAQTVPFDQEVFTKWVDMRVGDGKSPAIWWCYGEVYSYPDGKLLAYMDGIDVANLVKIAKDSVIQLNRKTFVYKHPETKEILYGEYNGKPVMHIEYPYQKITYSLKGDKLQTYVEQGAAPRITKMGPGYKTSARKLGQNYVYSSPVFLNFETPRGKYEAYENYDFFIAPAGKNTKDKYQLTWNRYGDLPPFLGGGKGVIQLVCHRVDNYTDLPESFQKHLKEKAPMWLAPPKNLEEITKLQAGK
jgi:hypothetical protein